MELDLSEGGSSSGSEENKNDFPPQASDQSSFEQLKDNTHGGNKQLYCLLEQVFRQGGRDDILFKTFGRELVNRFLSSVGNKTVSKFQSLQ
jgi:hypothetical protein